MQNLSFKDFEVISTLGSGAFSSVYKVKRISDGQIYALKKVSLPNLKYKEKINALNEIRILASINDSHIVSYKQAFYDDASLSLCIIMEYAPGGDLLHKINEQKKKGHFLPESLLWSYLIQILGGLRTLHNMKIVHRDLKSANIFIGNDGKTVKLGDLNVSKIVETGMAHTQAGTPYYASPEVWDNKPYGVKSDIWSLGCIMYELCALTPPFRSPNMNLLYKKVLKGQYEKIPSMYSAELSKVISMCLTVNPQTRPDCERLLSHPIIMSKMTEAEAENSKKSPVVFDLLDTIKMPRNLKNLTEILPKSKYRQEAVSLIDLDGLRERDMNLPAGADYKRPQTSLRDIDSQRAPAKGKENKETSLERNMVKEKPSLNKKGIVLPEVDKKSSKMTPIQRAAKGVLNTDPVKDKKALGNDLRVPRRSNLFQSDVSKKAILQNNSNILDPVIRKSELMTRVNNIISPKPF